jgi:lipopolysaccharide export system protein LptA
LKIFIYILLFCSVINASSIEVTANRVELIQKDSISKFTGNVKIKKDKDTIKADKIDVYLDKNRKPVKYHAIGNINIEIFNQKLHYKASSEELIFIPSQKKYQLIKNAKIEEITTNKKVIGEKVLFDNVTGDIKVLSDQKSGPVKFIFEIEDK